MSEGGVTKRLAAVLAADIVGYTRLMELDSEGTVNAWKAARSDIIDPSIAGHEGRIVKHTGDGFLAEFNTVQSAVECAVAMQDGLSASSLEFRMGVNLGDIFDDGEDIHGEGVNIAARIEALADAGGISISGGAYEQVRNRLDYHFEDTGEQNVKHVSAPVRVYRIVKNETPVNKLSSDRLALRDKPSIAVLPFDNMSGDPEQEYFSDGISEDIITELSRFRDFLVIARNTMFTYKGKPVNVREISREVNARYVVEGSVRKAGSRIRVTAQLIDGETGAHIWADKYDGVLEDVFSLQDEITSAIVSAVAPQYVNAEIARAVDRDKSNYSEWDLLMQARWNLGRYNATDAIEAERIYREVILHNPRNAEAHAWLAFLFLMKVSWGWDADPVAAKYEGIAAARRAAALDSMDAQVLAISGIMLLWEGDVKRGIETCRRAVHQNPNLALAHGLLAATLGLGGQYEEACNVLASARRLSPYDPELPTYMTAVALGAFSEAKYQDVIDLADEVIATNPDVPSSYRLRAAALIMLGSDKEARQAVKVLLKIEPTYSISVFKDFIPLSPEIIEHHVIALRKAGLPE